MEESRAPTDVGDDAQGGADEGIKTTSGKSGTENSENGLHQRSNKEELPLPQGDLTAGTSREAERNVFNDHRDQAQVPGQLAIVEESRFSTVEFAVGGDTVPGDSPEGLAERERRATSASRAGKAMARVSFDVDARRNRGIPRSLYSKDDAETPRYAIEPPRASVNSQRDQSPARLSFEGTLAARVPLPQSETSSVSSTNRVSTENALPLGRSLENLQALEQGLPVPKRKRKDTVLQWIAGGPKAKRKGQQSSVPLPPPSQPRVVAPEVEDYRNNVKELALHFTAMFGNVAATHTRHSWSPRIVFYDHLGSGQHQKPRRNEPWKYRASAPSYREFSNKLRMVADGCIQRTVLVEDLTPALIDLLGATFQIPPDVFEEHLDRSGYTAATESSDKKDTWHTRSSAQGYSSVTWWRPVLPLVPMTARFRQNLIADRRPRVRCPIVGCQHHDLHLATAANIWRHQLGLCPDPGFYHKTSDTEYPVGWEERATVWTRDLDGCRFVIVLLDPLPVVVIEEKDKDKNISVDRPYRREAPILAHLWYRQEEVSARRKARSQGPIGQNRQSIYDWIEEPVAQQGQGDHAPQALGATPSRVNQIRVTGVDTQSPDDDSTPAALRRRATKTDMEKPLDEASKERNRREGANRKDASEPLPPQTLQLQVAKPGLAASSGPLSSPPPSTHHQSMNLETHLPFVPYQPIQARSSSTTWEGDTISAHRMRTYIGNLQVPKPTLDEFDYFLRLPSKGKDVTCDPFRALFRTIHDDTDSLVNIIRTSLQRIREGTMDEDLMQERVMFWRSLLHKLNFNLSELDQNLRGFAQFVFESEAHPPGVELSSEKLAQDTRQTLSLCIELIERAARSLLSEMQIVDSRRSIAEAESVSKLTELAFVFIPLSFVASLFSMQVHELDGGVPLYQFTLVAVGFVAVAYAVRLSIRSSRLIEYKSKIFLQMRDESKLQYNEPIPTHKFVAWASWTLSGQLFKILYASIWIVGPLVITLSVIAAIMSPIVLLWQRNIDRGFSAVITVLILLLDAILVVPVAVNMSNAGLINLNPKEYIRKMKLRHELHRKRREKAKRRHRQRAGLDPEAPDDESFDRTGTASSV